MFIHNFKGHSILTTSESSNAWIFPVLLEPDNNTLAPK